MKRAAVFLMLLATTACSRSSSSDRGKPISSAGAPASTSPVRTQFTLTIKGEAFGLRVEGGSVSFCDTRGGRKLDTTTGHDAAFQRSCAKEEPNSGCGGLPLDVQVSTPGFGPNDRIELSGSAYPVEGHVHDCAVDGKVLAAITGQGVVLIDTTEEHVDVLDHHGGDRVTIGPGWIAWSKGSTIEARRR